MKVNAAISSGNITLRTLTIKDCNEEYLRWMCDTNLNKYLEVRHSPPTSICELRSYVEEILSDKENLLMGIFYDDEHVGNIKLGPICPVHGKSTIGLLIGRKEFWGMGIATTAIKLITKYAFEILSVEKLEAGCYSENLGSYKAFIKAGFSCEGVLKSSRQSGSKRDDELLLGYTFKDYKERKPIIFDGIKSIVFIGGGQLMCEAASYAKSCGFDVVVMLSERHSQEYIESCCIQDYLHSNEIAFEIHSHPTTIDPTLLGFDPQLMIAICFGPAWIFPESILEKFPRGMFNFNGIPIPKYQGGAHYTWQILNSDLTGGCNLQIITSEIDAGDIIDRHIFRLPNTARIPKDYFEINKIKGLEFIKAFIDKAKKLTEFKRLSYKTLSMEREYFPRLRTDINGYINWEWTGKDIEKFCNAFDDPYAGARTFLNGFLVRIKKVSYIQNGEFNYHPFCNGLILRKNEEGIFVAAVDGIIKISGLIGDENNSTGNFFEGDRFYTPIKYLEESMQYKPKVMSDGSLS